MDFDSLAKQYGGYSQATTEQTDNYDTLAQKFGGSGTAPKKYDMLTGFDPNPTGESPYKTGNFFTTPLLDYTPSQGLGATVTKAALNVPSSALRLGKAIVDPRTYWNLGKVAAGAVESIPGIREIYDQIPDKSPFVQNPEKSRAMIEDTRAAFNNFADNLFNSYGTMANLRRSLTEDPVGVFLIGQGLARGGSAAASKLGLNKTAEVLSKTAEQTTPKNLYSSAKGYVSPNQPIEGQIVGDYTKAVKPSVSGKSSAAQVEKYNTQVNSAVQSIVKNKSALSLVDEHGQAVQGNLPQTLTQFSQAIGQTKKAVFQKYDAMASAAGQSGVSVPLTQISSELNSIGNNKVLQDVRPDVANYAKQQAQIFAERGNYSPTEAQDAIQLYNESLQAFYRNPTYESASKAAIDAMVANNFRKLLDDAIEKNVAPGYQELKNEYGALKTIEADVTKRSIVDARKNVKGLIDFSDIFSGSQVVNGILSFNPQTIAAGMAAKSIAALYKHLNNPNRLVKRMFENADSLFGNIAPDERAPGAVAPNMPQGSVSPTTRSPSRALPEPAIRLPDQQIYRPTTLGQKPAETVQIRPGQRALPEPPIRMPYKETPSGSAVPAPRMLPQRNPSTGQMQRVYASSVNTQLPRELPKLPKKLRELPYPANVVEGRTLNAVSAATHPKDVSFVSPNEAVNLQFKDAVKRVKSPEHLKAVQEFEKISRQDGIRGQTKSGIGVWSDGAEDTSYFVSSERVDPEKFVYDNAKKALITNQKQFISFVSDPAGKDELYSFSFKGKNPKAISDILSKNGIVYQTIGEGEVLIFNKAGDYFDNEIVAKLEKVATQLKLDKSSISLYNGNGDFYGSWLPGEEARAEARQIYSDIIASYEKKYGKPGKGKKGGVQSKQR